MALPTKSKSQWRQAKEDTKEYTDTLLITLQFEVSDKTCLLNVEPLDKDGNPSMEEFMYHLDESNIMEGTQKP